MLTDFSTRYNIFQLPQPQPLNRLSVALLEDQQPALQHHQLFMLNLFEEYKKYIFHIEKFSNEDKNSSSKIF